MKILKVIVDEVPDGCAGKVTRPDFHPKPCQFMMVGDGLWCFITNKSIEVDNDPYKGERPECCPLVSEDDYFDGIYERWGDDT